MPRRLAPGLGLSLALVAGLALGADEAAPTPTLPVLNVEKVTPKSRNDEDVQTKELWFRRHDGKTWGEWQKHGIPFARENPVDWAPPEGRLQTYVRIIEVNNRAMDLPKGDVKPVTEFIIDRTAPTVAVTSPTPRTKLRGGQPFTVRWTATDPNLAANPIAIEFSRDGTAFEPVIEGLPNTGTHQITMPRDMTPTGVIRVVARDRATKTANVGHADAAQLLVDSIAPSGRVTGPAISAAHELALAIDVKDAGPAGLASTQLWFSGDEGQSWVEGPTITEDFKTLAWTAPRDGRYRLALVSLDQAGNPTPTPKTKSDDQFSLLVDTAKPTITLASAVGIAHASDEKGDPRKFKPGDRVQVQFAVKDGNLAPNPVAIHLQTDPAKGWTEIARGLPADSAHRFAIDAVPGKSRAEARIRLTAVDVAGNIGETLAVESFIIDSEVEVGEGGLEGLEESEVAK